jgi:NAD/NADP transhydrogenase alpha subunit
MAELPILSTALAAFTIVISGMLLLTAACVAIRYLIPGQTPAVTGAAAPALAGDAELVAVITAAAAVALGAPVVVRRIHVRAPAETERWSRAGRMDIMVSHRVGPRR